MVAERRRRSSRAARAHRIGAAAVLAYLLAFLDACGGASRGPAAAPPTPPPAAAAERPSDRATASPPEMPPSSGSMERFTTDFAKHSVPYDEIISGGPPKDGIPAIDHPAFVPVSQAGAWLAQTEPVLALQVGGDARAYPIQILMWHEIVNDTVGGVPLAITYCPLCNTAIVFERSLADRILEFGSTGRLRYSNLVMYDRQTESWWQQATGEAIAGELTGAHLVFRPASIISWGSFAAAHPAGRVLSRDTGLDLAYGKNPYPGYDDVTNPPFLYVGPETPGRMPAVARVLAVDLGGDAVAYPYSLLQEVKVINDRVGGTDIVVLWAPGTASALDAASVSGGRDVGSANAFSRSLGGRTLTFARAGARILDRETGSEWDATGRSLGGELAGSSLTPIVAVNHLWFSWAAFRPRTRIYEAPR